MDGKDILDLLAVPKGEKHPRPKFAQLPEIESFAKTDNEKKLLSMWRGFIQNGHIAFRITAKDTAAIRLNNSREKKALS